MAYTDLSAAFSYKQLFTHQLADQIGENDKVFYELLFGTTDMDNNFKFNNAKYIQGEVAAGGTYKKIAGIDASNIVQLGESGTEVRVPADPSNALGVATKQYVDGVQMFQTQAIVSAAPNGSGTLATILSLSATTRGRLHAIWHLKGSQPGTLRVKITLDGTVVIDNTSPSIALAEYVAMKANGELWDTNSADDGDAAFLIELPFNSTCLIEAAISDAGSNSTVKVLYSKIP
mgnify:FL=1